MKNLLKMSVATAALLIAGACSEGTETASAPAEEKATQVAAAKPELGTWGVDMTAQKTSVKPGDDFFQYANGTWLDTFELPADKTNYGAFNVLGDRSRDQVKAIIDELASGSYPAGSVEQKISDYYNSYMDVETINKLGIAPLQPTLDYIAGISDVAGLTEAFGRQDIDSITSPLGFGPGINRTNPDAYQMNLGFGGMGLPDKDYYFNEAERFVKIREAYVAYIEKMLTFAGVEGAAEKAQAVMALETKLAEKQWERADRRNRDKTFNPINYADLATEYPGIDWDAMFKAAGYADFADLNVSQPSAVKDAIELINTLPIEDWKAYMTFHLISDHSAVLPEEIDQAAFDFYGKTLRGQPQQRARWERAVGRVGALNALGEAIAQVYVKRHFPESSKAQMSELVENLRTALGQRIDGLEWMGDDTKVEARKKLASFNPKIGYPNKWKDLSSMEIKAGDLFGNAKSIRLYNYEDTKSRLHKKTDKDEWFMTPQTVNAYYNPAYNEIVFPAAILQAPFFDPAADPAVNYGGIGAVIGHEMGHGFDDQGSKSDSEGVQRNWWTDEDRTNFEARTKALAAQYDKFEAVPGNFVDGNFTLGENIGDLGGLAMAYHAYKLSLGGKEAPVIDGLTGDQRFFLAWAQVWKRKYREAELINRLKSDPHSPSEFRVNGIVRNMPEWYEAFGVKEGDALYLAPAERVAIW
ncbi:M13 family metallopeptidase [Kordiimonas sp. SCSIO 12603]|uniref:M13 family metallopeptidase n=1 Tax=Kordiimonas sp. SCSIO 12603 TaxID=2829596 RepID=UPI00210530E4|nr:M13 family metallopeptidase [Kordiimonas sp. SCSIO 12603]UTW59789.1 M13 family metallopeptidase [Kordiimonas sp. SCSIO 12603]